MSSVTENLACVKVREEKAFVGLARHSKQCRTSVRVIANELKKRQWSPQLSEREITEGLYQSRRGWRPMGSCC